MSHNHWLSVPAPALQAEVDLWICAICGLHIHRVHNRRSGCRQFFAIESVPRLLARWAPGDPCPRGD
jgi:hypothetical protein